MYVSSHLAGKHETYSPYPFLPVLQCHWDIADQNKADANTRPLPPCLQVNEVHEDLQVSGLPADISGMQGSFPVNVTTPPFLYPLQESRVSLAFQPSPPTVSLCHLSSLQVIVPRLKPGGKILLC